MAISLIWIRDNFDKNKDRYIDGTEFEAAKQAWLRGEITNTEYGAVINVNNNNTLLPAYSTSTTSHTVTFNVPSGAVLKVGSTVVG